MAVTMSTKMLTTGDFFGEIALLDGGPCSAAVTAHTEAVADVISQREFATLMDVPMSAAPF
jgi:CRP-like cAMP-binding protein